MQPKEPVTLYSADSLKISASDYFTHDTLPYLILIHEQGSSKGEFNAIIDRFEKMDLNCLAVDVRNGGNSRFFSNETAKRSKQGDFDSQPADVENDILAAIGFAAERTNEQVILLGAGANGSICLKIASENPGVHSVIAMSPGEFFRPALSIEDTIAGMQKPVLVTATRTEYPYMVQLTSGIGEEFVSVFQPEEHEGSRGTSALYSDNPSSSEYWLAILLFFKEMK